MAAVARAHDPPAQCHRGPPARDGRLSLPGGRGGPGPVPASLGVVDPGLPLRGDPVVAPRWSPSSDPALGRLPGRARLLCARSDLGPVVHRSGRHRAHRPRGRLHRGGLSGRAPRTDALPGAGLSGRHDPGRGGADDLALRRAAPRGRLSRPGRRSGPRRGPTRRAPGPDRRRLCRRGRSGSAGRGRGPGGPGRRPGTGLRTRRPRGRTSSRQRWQYHGPRRHCPHRRQYRCRPRPRHRSRRWPGSDPTGCRRAVPPDRRRRRRTRHAGPGRGGRRHRSGGGVRRRRPRTRRRPRHRHGHHRRRAGRRGPGVPQVPDRPERGAGGPDGGHPPVGAGRPRHLTPAGVVARGRGVPRHPVVRVPRTAGAFRPGPHPPHHPGGGGDRDDLDHRLPQRGRGLGPGRDAGLPFREGPPGALRRVRPLPQLLRPFGQPLLGPPRRGARHRDRVDAHTGGAPRRHGLVRGLLRRPRTRLGARRRPAVDRPHQHLVLRHVPGADPGDRRLRDPGRPTGPRSAPGRAHRIQRRHHQPGHGCCTGRCSGPARSSRPHSPAGTVRPCTSATGTCPSWSWPHWPWWPAGGWPVAEGGGLAMPGPRPIAR